jgi:hypothetical protein
MLETSRHPFRVTLIALVCAFLLLAAFRFRTTGEHAHAVAKSSAVAARLASLPPVILWAWERPEKLDYLDPQKVGVAFLAKTIYLRGDEAISRARLQPLNVPNGAAVIAVARIEAQRESDSAETPTLSRRQLKDAVSEIAELGSLPNVVMVQVDFDATTTQRSFYRELLSELRARLPQSTLLSITALASWCKGDNWLDDLPIDEAVPMLFRMGVERKQFLSQLAAGVPFSAAPCQASVGISTDEPIAQLPPGQQIQRVYIFNPKSWSLEAVNQTLETYQK